MKTLKVIILILNAIFIAGCASINFNGAMDGNGLTYYEPKPYLFVTVTDKCISSATVVSVPAKKKKLEFNSGYGSSSLSAEFSNGVLTKVGQTSDSKIPETLTSIAAMKSAGSGIAGAPPSCAPSAILYPIVNGIPNINEPINFTVIKQP